MFKKHNKERSGGDGDNGNGIPVILKRFSMFPETAPYKPKLMKKAPSMRAINNYNNIRTSLDGCGPDGNNGDEKSGGVGGGGVGYDNFMFYGDDETSYSMKVEPSEISYHNYALNNNNKINEGTLGRNLTNGNGNGNNACKIFVNSSYNGGTGGAEMAMYDYPTWKSSMATGISSDATTVDSSSRKDDLGSTSKLVSSKVTSNCSSCYAYTEIVLCTIAIAANFGNLYRLPAQIALVNNNNNSQQEDENIFIPFILVYILLSLIVGLPLLFLEIGIGQIIQEGVLKTWRAVPFFRGVGYIKILAGIILTIYYPIYAALGLYYIIYIGKDNIPFSECSNVKLTEKGYSAEGISGLQCLKKTFLESPYVDPYWFGVFAALLLLLWIALIIFLIKGTKSFVKILTLLLIPTLATLIYMAVYACEHGSFSSFSSSSQNVTTSFGEDINWKSLGNFNVWYYASIQVFFSSNVGFGVFITNGTYLYKKVHPLYTSVSYTLINLILGVGTSVLYFSLNAGRNVTVVGEEEQLLPKQIKLFANIYDIAKEEATLNGEGARIFAIVSFSFIVLTCLISLVTNLYAVLKSISIDTRRRYSWWQMLTIYGFIALILSSAILLCLRLQILHLLDEYVVGNLILICVVLEVLGFVLFYGSKRLLADFEFIIGRKVSSFWLVFWWTTPLLLAGFLTWRLVIENIISTEQRKDPIWLYATGWGIILTALVFILIMGLYNVAQQEEYYTFADKFKASVKCSRKWGPIDPILRYNWVQWHSKAKDGERDFTLKRRGTRDYAHSVKKRSNNKTYTPASLRSEASTGTLTYINALPPPQQQQQVQQDQNPLKVTSLIDTFGFNQQHKTNLNPLAHQQQLQQQQLQQQTKPNRIFVEGLEDSDGYGTFRKGPYVIGNEEEVMEHVCHRRNSEEATEL